MAMLVHLADEKDAASILRAGIRIAKYRQGIYCMPVLPNFYVSHQWLRELKRRGAKSYIGVYFKVGGDTMVYAGRYNAPHQYIPLREAIREIMKMDDPLGFELIISRKILPGEITKVRNLPQTLGWRYMPYSHQRKPSCGCPMCIRPGTIKGRILREKIDPPVQKLTFAQLLQKLQTEKDENKIEGLLWDVKSKVRKSDPRSFHFLLEMNSPGINRQVADVLSAFRHKNTRDVLRLLMESRDKVTRENAKESFEKLYPWEKKT